MRKLDLANSVWFWLRKQADQAKVDRVKGRYTDVALALNVSEHAVRWALGFFNEKNCFKETFGLDADNPDHQDLFEVVLEADIEAANATTPLLVDHEDIK